MTSTYRQTLLNLVVGEYCTQRRTPVYHRVGAEGKAVVLQYTLFLCLAHRAPLLGSEAQRYALGGIEVGSTLLLEVGNKRRDRLSALSEVVVPVVEHLQERPLCPVVVLWLAGAHLTRPVEREAYLVELRTVTSDILVGGNGGVLARLYGILLGGQTKGVVAHRMQDVEAHLTLIA